MLDSPNPFDASKEQFVAAKALLEQIIRSPDLEKHLDFDARPNGKMVYTKAVCIWLLILQRLRGGDTLEKVVSDAVKNPAGLFPDNKRVREGTLAESNSAFTRARMRLPLEAITNFSRLACDHLARTSDSIFDNRRVFILDGTTLALPPTPELKKAFPPATNQHGESVWPIAMLLVAAEMQSGCILVPRIFPMYGPNNSCETREACKIVNELPDNSIVMADSGFGTFSVAFHTVQANHDFLFRLTLSRFKSMRKSAELIAEGESYRSYQLHWTPSPNDRKGNPDLPPDASLNVFIHEVTLPDKTTLAMVTPMPFDALCMSELYRRRYDIEFDIRDVKVTMDTESIRAKKVDTVMQELKGSIVAYNLVAQVRRGAAKLAGVKPRELSFTGVWVSFQTHLLEPRLSTFEEWSEAMTRTLVSASKRRLPVRSKARSSPRIAHTRRRKSTKSQKSSGQKKSQLEQPPPPE